MVINPPRACAARVTVVDSACPSVCPENAVTYSAGNEGQKICVKFRSLCGYRCFIMVCTLCNCACVHVQATQVEVVLLVFRRLAEDLHVHTDTSLTSTRRKEMGAALREQIRAIYHFLMQNLEVHCMMEYMSQRC